MIKKCRTFPKMSIDASRISIYCGNGKVCNHNGTTLLQKGYESEPIYYDWPHQPHGVLARMIADAIGCSSCLVLSSLMAEKCNDDKCLSSLHCIDAYSEERMEQSEAAIMRSNFLCHHSQSPFTQLALEQNDVVISNDPRSDVRFPGPTKCHSAMPLDVHNLMIVPLFVVGRPNHIGVVMCVNKKEPFTTCNGFDPEDYSENYQLFFGLSQHLLLSYQERRIMNLERTLEKERRENKEEIKRVTLNTNSFIATMSHELRTPLNAINGYNEIMLANKLGSENAARFAKWLRKQRDATLTLTQLLANILDFAKLKTSGVKLDVKAFSLEDTMNKAMDLCSRDCSAKNIKLSMAISEVPNILVGDEGRISQVIVNLLMNAVKYTTHGFIILRAYGKTNASGQVDLKISVEDSGRGVPPHLQEEIFSEFRQIRDSMSPTAASTQGVGLGLAICKEIVTLMGGRIWVESDGRSGSTFSFTIQLRDQSSMDRMIEVAKASLKDGAVLIVDDQEVNRILMTRMFFQWEMRPHACSTIEEAVMMLESYPKDYFKLAVIDIDLNDESGASLARRITRDRAFDHVALIAASSMGAQFSGSEYFDVVHTKPIAKDKLLEDITRLLEHGYMRKQISVPSSSHKSEQTDGYILIVDDDAGCVSVCEELLDQLGYTKHEAAVNAMEAMQMLAATPNRYEIVLMDVLMPKINGIQCSKLIKNDPVRFGSPTIIALSADATEKTKNAMLDIGAKEFISKPVSLADMQRAFEQYYTSSKPRTKARKKKSKKK